jgi:hypothetical protein
MAQTQTLGGSSPMSNPSSDLTLGEDLAAFQQAQGLSDSELAEWLGITVANLPRLAQSPRPDPHGITFQEDCRRIAQDTGCDAWALQLLLLRQQGGR